MRHYVYEYAIIMNKSLFLLYNLMQRHNIFCRSTI